MSPRPAARWSASWRAPGRSTSSCRSRRKILSSFGATPALSNDIIRRHRIDIVHARSRAPAWSALWAARATRRRFVTTFHNAYDTDLPLKRWYNSVMARGERVIAISQFVGEHAASTYGIGPDRLRVIPRGVDLAAFDPHRVRGDRVAALARQWRVPDDVKIVMLPGRLTRWKGGLDFIEAVARLGRRDLCCSAGRRRAARPASAANWKPRSSGSASSACSGSSITAPTCRRPICCRTSSSRRRTSRRGSAASSSRRRRWAVRSSRPITAARARRSCPASPAGSPHRAIRPRWRDAIGEALALDDEARSAFARRAMSHIAAGFTSELMCARTIDVYEELLFPQTATAGGAQARELLAIPA